MPVLCAHQLAKSYGTLKAVDGVSFDIEPGEVFGLLGPNGAGKSTTINIIASILRPDGGEVRVDGVPLSNAPAYKRLLGFVPQEICLADKLTARENLSLIGRLYDLRGRALRGRVDEALAAVGLSDRGDDLIAGFSGGMKRRINIAAALLHEPRLLLLDEPTAGVDPQARAYIFELVERLAASGRAILYTTHYMEEAQRLCKRTAIIDHGRLLALGTLPELTRRAGSKRELVIQARAWSPGAADAVSAGLGGAPFRLNDDLLHLMVEESERVLVDAARAAGDVGVHVVSIRFDEPNLETVFLELTGRALRD